jgi:hypothetical protein
MDPESSDSDVSVAGDGHYRNAAPLTTPLQLPPPPPKHVLESTENVETRLRELSHVDEHNFGKLDMLRAKRRRKDERIAQKRDAQDRKIRTIMEARDRRDSRIQARRAKEDAAFKAVDDQIEEEEMVCISQNVLCITDEPDSRSEDVSNASREDCHLTNHPSQANRCQLPLCLHQVPHFRVFLLPLKDINPAHLDK